MITTVFHKGGASAPTPAKPAPVGDRPRSRLLPRQRRLRLDRRASTYSPPAASNTSSSRESARIFPRSRNPSTHRARIHPSGGCAGGPPLTVLSYELWQRVFRGDPIHRGPHGRPARRAAYGRRHHAAGLPHRSAGRLWTPLQPSTSGEGGGDNYGIIARLKPGVTFAQADGQLNSIMVRSSKPKCTCPSGVNDGRKSASASGRPHKRYSSKSQPDVGRGRTGLLIGCVNIAGILLARSAARSREIATRMAIGAGRARVMSQLLCRSCLARHRRRLTSAWLIGEFALKGLIALNPES